MFPYVLRNVGIYCCILQKVPDVNKEERRSFPAHHSTAERPVCVCQPRAHLQERSPLFNYHLSVPYWPEDCSDMVMDTRSS
jgi:hypothetical protein